MEVSTNAQWFGIDVSKATFDIALFQEHSRKPPHQKFPRTPQGCRECLCWVTEHLPPGHHPSLVMEATGGYSQEMAHWLLALKQGIKVSIAQPLRVHHFAKGFGLTNKTDAQDAIMLARYGEVHHPPVYRPMSPCYEQLRALTRERAALVKAATSLGNRNELPSASPVAQEIREQMLAHHKKAVKDLDKAIQALIRREPNLAADATRLQTLAGVGPVVSSTLMGELGDLREYPTPKALTAFTGVVPNLKDSGTSVHEPAHMSKHGSGRVRQVLYMAALTAIRGDNTLARSYDHLLKEGKPPLVAIGAVMRKILVLARVLLISGKDYDPKFSKEESTKDF